MTKTTPIWLATVTAFACSSGPPDLARPVPPQVTGVSIRVDATPVPLNAEDLTQTAIGAFAYAGGIEITSAESPGLHELSDLEILPNGQLVAVSDQGYLLEARLVVDERGRPTGLADARVTRLVDQQGRLLEGTAADAEGLATLSNGDRLVSFERDHRIWLYPAGGGTPRPAPMPDATFPDNAGMEALTAFTPAGPNAYLVGSEGGKVWLCEVADGCRDTVLGRWVPPGLSLTALAAYGNDGSLALLSRAYDPRQGNRISVKLIGDANTGGGHLLDELTIAAPLTRDNFEAMAIVPRQGGGIRVYLLSDDNGSPTQHTYLLAFDWNPAS